jgi:hypothetical protein
MTSSQRSKGTGDTGGTVVCCIFIILAAVSLWDTTHMLDSDSYVFPRAIAISLIVFSISLIVWNIAHPDIVKQQRPQNESTVRRTLLIALMLLSCFSMPWLGFLISGIITFLLLMVVAMYHEWDAKKRIVYPLIAVAIVVGFYTLFSRVLLVPLPTALLFE